MKKNSPDKKKHKTFILALDRDDPEKELEFELEFQTSLTTQERFKMMFDRSKEVAEMMRRNGYSKSAKIVKRA